MSIELFICRREIFLNVVKGVGCENDSFENKEYMLYGSFRYATLTRFLIDFFSKCHTRWTGYVRKGEQSRNNEERIQFVYKYTRYESRFYSWNRSSKFTYITLLANFLNSFNNAIDRWSASNSSVRISCKKKKKEIDSMRIKKISSFETIQNCSLTLHRKKEKSVRILLSEYWIPNSI